MRAPWDEAGQLRRPLPNARLRIVASGEREERRRRFGQCPLRAPIPVTHELMSVLSKSYQGTTNSISCVTREPTAFCLDFFIFFLESISQIRKNEQKLGRMLFSQVTFCCGMTP